ncbi:hypothetical protein DAPPUDRAFT_241112 [Daphnia pulex]|uniref:Uncharacterized protein n=1 Tax=Daphnia pulex TaxID=6669 RepID=E9GDF9_DAPPU|nr:hypothetical protein DAPPUDRAFT_241112 [Daphnia pulex]|eukprot:EFX82075.1 hypothetical protein DAPPUDRAFT_241112 [Daphnia pulex]
MDLTRFPLDWAARSSSLRRFFLSRCGEEEEEGLIVIHTQQWAVVVVKNREMRCLIVVSGDGHMVLRSPFTALAGRFETPNSRSFDRQAVERSSVKVDLHVTGRVGEQMALEIYTD